MNNMLKILSLILLAVQFTWSAASLEIEPERVTPNKPFIVNLVVPKNEIPKNHKFPELKDLKGMTLLKKDSTDDVQRSFFGNTHVRKYRFHLKPPKAGSFRLGPLVWNINNKDQVLGYAQVSVKRGYDAPGISVNISPNKRVAYVGEQLRLNLNIDIYENFQGNLRWTSSDLGNDFWSQKSDREEAQSKRSSRPGVMQELSQTYAFVAPMKQGQLQIKPAKFEYTKQGEPKVKEVRQGNFYSRSVSSEPIETSAFSRPITITAKPLPSGAPSSFSGMVGNYSFSAKVDRSNLQVGEALTLRVKIRGNGRPASIPDPKMPNFDDFRSVPPEVSSSTKITGGQLWTTRELKIYLYPKKKGEFKIDTIKFSYFDPKQKKYIEEIAGPFKITVEKGNQELIPEAATNNMMFADKREIEHLGKDIRYIHENTAFKIKGSRLYKMLWFWIIFISPIIMVLLLKVYYQNRINKLGDLAYQRRKSASKLLTKHLKQAKLELKNKNAKMFYAELDKGVNDFLSNQFNVEFRGMTLVDRINKLSTLAYDRETLKLYEDFSRKCEYAQFSASDNDSQEMNNTLTQAENLLKQLETKI